MIPEDGNGMVPARDLYPVNDAAYRLGISPRKLWTLIYERRIRAVQLDGRRLIPAEELARFIAGLPEFEPSESKKEAAA